MIEILVHISRILGGALRAELMLCLNLVIELSEKGVIGTPQGEEAG